MKFSREIQTLLADYTGQPLPFKALKRTEEHGFGMMITDLAVLNPSPAGRDLYTPEYRVFPTRVQLGLGFHRPWLPQRLSAFTSHLRYPQDY